MPNLPQNPNLQLLTDQDPGWSGVNTLMTPAQLPVGEAAAAYNVRFTTNTAEPRLGLAKLPWSNRTTSNSTTALPFGVIYGGVDYAGALGTLGADQAHEITQLPEDQRHDAIVEALGGLLGQSLLGPMGVQFEQGRPLQDTGTILTPKTPAEQAAPQDDCSAYQCNGANSPSRANPNRHPRCPSAKDWNRTNCHTSGSDAVQTYGRCD